LTKILLAQNSLETLKSVREVLDRAGYMVMATDRLKTALRKLESDTAIDLLMIDADFQQRDLDRFLENIKSSQRFLDLPVIMTSAQWSHTTITHFKEMGVKDCIALPLSIDLIKTRIDEAIATGKRTILVVDDDELIRDLLKNVLELERFKVMEAENGKRALELLKDHAISAVVSDIIMPEMTGLELMEIIKMEHADIPVIIITGFSGDYTPEDVMGARADGFFSKPFKNIELIQKLRSVLAANAKRIRANPV